MSKETRTISDLVNTISEEMTRRDYKPTVLKQYYIVWNKLCQRAGAQPANDFDMQFGMTFLDETMRAHPKHLKENSKHRWIKAIYTLADFKRTGILSLRREKRGFIFSELTKSAFRQFTAHQSAIGLSEAHIRDTCLYLERFSKYLEQQCLDNIAGLATWHVQGFVNGLAIYELPTLYHTTCVLRRALQKHGPHALRHSLASALLENDVPMPVISEALGHTDTESTSIISSNRCRQIARVRD